MGWDPLQPVKRLPKNVQNYFVGEATYLLHDLRQNRLEVILIPAPEPKHHSHKIRAVQHTNPMWYRELYHRHTHFRRDRSVAALERICQGDDRVPQEHPKKYQYDVIYRALILERLMDGYYQENNFIPPHPHVCRYMNS